jgi:EmrB/QacA subfamily drug resistance transporter
MVILDVAIVNVALPSIRSGLHFSATGLQWVVNAYTLTFAGFLMLGGRVADLLGRRRVLLAGVAAFGLSSLLCAVASSPGLLVGARALQGIAGAVVSPATLSIISTSLPEGAERNRGLGLWAAMGGLGASSGALLGGVLTQAFAWPAIFAVNVPLGAIVIALGLRVIPAGGVRDDAALRHFDVSGALLVTAGLATVTFGIVRTESLGWGATGVLVPLAAGVVLIGSFLLVEGRIASAPLVPLSIFRLARVRAANLVVVLLYMALFSMWYFLTLYLQVVLGDSALDAGLSFLPLTLSVFTASSIAPGLVRRFGVRPVLSAGMLSAAAGMALLSGVTPGGTYVGAVLPGGVLASLGMGLSLVSATIAAMEDVDGRRAGVASGLLNTSRLVGGALGLAVLGTLAQTHTHHELAGAVGAIRALTDGYSLAFVVAAGVSLAGAALAVTLPRPRAAVAPVAAEAVAA